MNGPNYLILFPYAVFAERLIRAVYYNLINKFSTPKHQSPAEARLRPYFWRDGRKLSQSGILDIPKMFFSANYSPLQKVQCLFLPGKDLASF